MGRRRIHRHGEHAPGDVWSRGEIMARAHRSALFRSYEHEEQIYGLYLFFRRTHYRCGHRRVSI